MLVFFWAFILGLLDHIREVHMVTALWKLGIILQEAATPERDRDVV